MGYLRDFELEVKSKPDAKPVFHKPRSVPFAIQEDLALAYDAGITKGIWTPVQFCNWGTAVVPNHKSQNSEGKESQATCLWRLFLYGESTT